jgi:hypothetical protein
MDPLLPHMIANTISVPSQALAECGVPRSELFIVSKVRSPVPHCGQQGYGTSDHHDLLRVEWRTVQPSLCMHAFGLPRKLPHSVCPTKCISSGRAA